MFFYLFDNPVFNVDVLEDRLNDHVNLAKVRVVQSRYQVSHVAFCIELGDFLPLDTFVQIVLNLVDTSGKSGRAHVLQDCGVAFVDRDLSNTGTHQTSSKDAQGFG